MPVQKTTIIAGWDHLGDVFDVMYQKVVDGNKMTEENWFTGLIPIFSKESIEPLAQSLKQHVSAQHERDAIGLLILVDEEERTVMYIVHDLAFNPMGDNALWTYAPESFTEGKTKPDLRA